MPPDPAPAKGRRALSSLDHRIEAATGHDVDTLWTHRERGVLDEDHARLVDQHRELTQAETGVTFHRTLLNRLSSGEFPVDRALLQRIARTLDQLGEAADVRAAVVQRVLAALEPIEAAAASTLPTVKADAVSAADQAALLAIAGGAKLYEHLLTHRMSVTCASGARIPYVELQRLENAGLAFRDTDHPVHAGQPVVLTDAGRAALRTARPQPTPTPLPKRAVRPGSWPSTPAPRR
ncbi:hypothetical protein ACFT4A_31615 [Streptomyces sp. NPDC057099]|uniref:hypothetical protein n=1 Tax=Streptomyces sp. NPDC057099 TaxID=3346019 RepID=UPI00363546B7